MKKTLLYLSFFVLVTAISSCEKAEDTQKYCSNGIKDHGETDIDCGGTCTACLPAQVVSAYTFQSDNDSTYFTGTGFTAQISGNAGHKVMRLGSTNSGVTFSITFSDPEVGQSRTVNSASLTLNDYFILEPGDNGAAMITELDTTRKLASGTFYFQVTRGGGNDKAQVRHGSFTNLRYIE